MTGSGRPALLAPALWLADRVRTSTRLGVLCVVLLIPGLGATWAYTGSIDGQINFTGAEVDGTEVVHPRWTSWRRWPLLRPRTSARCAPSSPTTRTCR
ncbi:hypothetical protein ACFPIJ_53435 [Dactylosporangium cerinum]|uniref:Uncharacterized protein n=1 Tax=Dactylosporangium cerinum TaxID=1434730 RepID=A0ABV9WEY7_9ACTN